MFSIDRRTSMDFRTLQDGILDWLTLQPMTGPILDKELRVTSRRKRYFVLRVVYLANLLIILAMAWADTISSNQSSLMTVSRMAIAGQVLTSFIVWFQFIGLQVVAVILLSTAISEEIYHKTLGVLMTTPITAAQIVLGKLLSRLWQLLLLLGISLPVLAVVRVFGGIPWGFLAAGLTITLCMVLFVGALTMLWSIYCRRAYAAIILSVLTLLALFSGLPFLVMLIMLKAGGGDTIFLWLGLLNPYTCQIINTALLFEPRGMPAPLPFPVEWLAWMHCGLLLAATLLILLFCMWKVRKVALRQIVGEGTVILIPQTPGTSSAPDIIVPRLRTVRGQPVYWKECRLPLFGRHKIAAAVFLALGLGVLGLIYALLADSNDLKDSNTHATFGVIFMGIALLITATVPAATVTSERESGSLPLLLTTTLTDWQILFGKFFGAIQRCLPVWGLLMGHLALFVVVGYLHRVVLPYMAIVAAWILILFAASGVYFSVRFRHTTTAVIMNMATWAAVWGLVPAMLGFTALWIRLDSHIVESYMDIIPFVQCAILIDGAAGDSGTFDWIGLNSLNIAETLVWLVVCFVGYSLVAAGFLVRAKMLLRRKAMQ
jgi:ABC-type transport system involved in multi-copper enzyme maturation permease subunit